MSEETTMRAIRIHAFEEDPRREAGIARPAAGPDEVLIRVEAAALNPLDAHLVSGLAARFFPIAFPYILGSDGAGRVEAVGEAVTQWTAGDRVIFWSDPLTGGAFADVVAVPAHACVALPASLSFAEGAAIPTAATTAFHMLFTAGGLAAGETVLIHAATGGVGSFAVQFARRAGARVVATASGEGVALARELGADEAIDYRAGDFARTLSGIDLVLDLVGGETQARSLDVLRPGGRLLSAVQPPDEATARERGIAANFFVVKPHAPRLAEVVASIADAELRVLTDSVVPFSSFDDAFARLRSGRARGKIVLTPD